jgi:hypothetical protein
MPESTSQSSTVFFDSGCGANVLATCAAVQCLPGTLAPARRRLAGGPTKVWRFRVSDVGDVPIGMLDVPLAEADSDGKHMTRNGAITLRPLVRLAATLLVEEVLAGRRGRGQGQARSDQSGEMHGDEA